MRVIGIDPGLVRTGWAVVEPDGRQTRVLAHGLIAPLASADLPARLAEGARGLRTVLSTYAPQSAALEEVFTAPRHPRSALLMAHMRGVICLVLHEAGVAVLPLTATTVKQRLTGSGHASKAQIQRMVLRLSGITEAPRMRWDESDALALAIAGLSQMGYADGLGRGRRRLSPVVEAALARRR